MMRAWDAVRRQFERLIQLARRQGSAVAIGHPHASTLQVLEEALPRLAEQGVRLVPVSRLVEQQFVRDSQWRLSLSPWPRAAKNSRPSP
uniref:divergent polysaccharide deacetylase family protein n=1 Tax=Thiohalobacter thiocyanaticus TaxID=585455 RepID=UPI0037DC0751